MTSDHWQAWRVVAATLVLLLACVQAILPAALLFGCFIDENATVSMAANFFAHGQYAMDITKPFFGAFEGIWSIGILSSWPAGVGWLAGGNLLSARLAAAAYCLALTVGLGVYVTRTAAPALRPLAVPLSLLVFYLMCVLVPGLPHIIVQNMGELSGALLLAFGFALGRSRPRLAAFVFGLCVWHSKFIYAPLALLGIAFSAARQEASLGGRARLLAVQLGLFLLPLVAWVLLIWIRTGTEGLAQWLHERGRLHRIGHYSDVDTPLGAQDLRSRLASPTLEWSHYAPTVKIKVVALLFFPVVVLFEDIVVRWRAGRRDLVLDVFQLGLIAALLGAAWWYFFLHQFMWIRHVTPFLLLGLGAVLYLAMVRAVTLGQRWRSRIAVTLLLAVVCDAAWGLPSSARLISAARESPPFVVACRSDTPAASTPYKTIKCWRATQRRAGEPVGLLPGEQRAVSPSGTPGARTPRRAPGPGT